MNIRKSKKDIDIKVIFDKLKQSEYVELKLNGVSLDVLVDSFMQINGIVIYRYTR